MHSRLRRPCALFYSAALFLSLVLCGCGQPVREDRSINWSGEGQSVGFQHGQEGVFLADKKGGNLTKIFQPGSEVLATSTPLWNPADRRVIFTTARAPNGRPAAPLPFLNREQDAAGNICTQQPVLYTCWLHEEAEDNRTAQPIALFEAACDHVGYVAANLAVRWHPQGDRIFYIKQIGERKHGLFEFDLNSKRSQQAFPYTAEALIFDWTRDGSHLVCVLGSTEKGRTTDGIWIGRPGDDGWWHVPESGELAQAELPSLLEQLRATWPAWTTGGARFGYVTYKAGRMEGQPGRYSVQLGTLATRAVEVLAEGPEPFSDLHWARDGVRLGVVRGREQPSLHLVCPGGKLSQPVNRRPVRRFAGWNTTGDHLAYIVPAQIPGANDDLWALLLVPDDRARDSVYVADGAAKEPGRQVFSGMRVTFPQWSPREDKLSLWVTFSPAYRSLVSQWLRWGLRPGDPAAVFDLQTGQLGWMAVNPHEKVQVGHYYLLKRDYSQAWRWYEEAERELPAPKPATAREFFETLQNMTGPRDFSFFQYYCLTKQGHSDKAQAKLDQFKRLFLPRLVVEQSDGKPSGQAAAPTLTVDGRSLESWLQELLQPGGFFAPFLRDLYMAEVFLSLDAAEDGETFFRQALAAAETDPARLSSALVLAQLLLVEKKHQAYARLATDTMAPLLFRIGQSQRPERMPGLLGLAPELIETIGVLSLLPLCAPEFLAGLPNDQLLAITPRWEALRTQASRDGSRRMVDLVLRGLYQRLGREKERQQVAQRMTNTPPGWLALPGHGDMSEAIATIRKDIRALFQRP